MHIMLFRLVVTVGRLGIKNNFWIKKKCLEQVRVWRFTTIGRNYTNEELIIWRFDDLKWVALRTETNYP